MHSRKIKERPYVDSLKFLVTSCMNRCEVMKAVIVFDCRMYSKYTIPEKEARPLFDFKFEVKTLSGISCLISTLNLELSFIT